MEAGLGSCCYTLRPSLLLIWYLGSHWRERPRLLLSPRPRLPCLLWPARFQDLLSSVWRRRLQTVMGLPQAVF